MPSHSSHGPPHHLITSMQSNENVILEVEDTERGNKVLKEEARGDEETFTLTEALDAMKFGRAQLIWMFMCGSYWAADSMELMIASYLLPELRTEFGIDRDAASAVAGVTFGGIAIGSYACGMAADRFGRKPVFFVTALCTGLLGMASAWAPSYAWMMFLRGLMGIFLGGAPTAFGYFAETIPSNVRAQALVWFALFWTVGSITEAGLAVWLMPLIGWRWLLCVSAVPVLVLSLLTPLMMESPRFLVARGRIAEAERVLSRVSKLNRNALPRGRLFHVKPVRQPFSLIALFSTAYRRVTICLWIIWISNSFVYVRDFEKYGIVLFATEFFESSGHEDVLLNTLITASAELPGIIVVSLLINRLGRRGTQACCFVACAATTLLCMTPNVVEPVIIALSFVARAAILGAFTATYVYTPEVYPTSLRATGLGAASALAKVASVITPFVANKIEVDHAHVPLSLYGGLAVVAAIASLALPVESRGHVLTETYGEEAREVADPNGRDEEVPLLS